MDVVIIADFCGKFDGADNGRFMYLARILCREHDVEIVTSDFYHGTKEYLLNVSDCDGVRVTMLHEKRYSRNVSIRRLRSHWEWGREVGKYLEKRSKPDVVYCAMPPLKASFEAAKYCENQGIRFIIDVQDLWPEAFQLALNIPVLSDLIFFPLKRIADGVYSRADDICAVSKTYADRAMRVNEKCSEPHVVYLGTNLQTFDDNVAANLVEKTDEQLWLGYCGTLGASYDISIVIEALALLKGQGVIPPKFVVMGDGERRAEFEALANHLSVEAEFTGKLPYDQMCGILAACDIAVNPIVHGAAQSIINKHGDYASAGIPVISTQESQEYRALVDEYRMGFNCCNGQPDDFANKLKLLMESAELRRQMGENARKCAEERFDRSVTYQALLDSITKE